LRRLVVVVATLVSLLGWGALQYLAPPANANVGVLGTGVSPSRSAAIDNQPDCLEALPDGMSVRGVSDDGANVALDVLVLLDGITVAEAKDVFTAAQKSYTPLHVTLKPTFRAVTLQGVEGADLLEQAKALYHGARPAGSDVVHILTSKDIANAGDSSLAGLADCIGGVKDAAHAFSVSEGRFPPELRAGPVGVGVETAARVAGHEIGHLLGAQHHYANCAEGALNATTSVEAGTCTLMFNLADLAVTNFSTLNGTVVRAHAVDYAKP
jgi:hypothetical protein